MARGGARAGAGRPKGSKSRKNAQLLAAVERSGETPLEYLLRVMRDTKKDLVVRLDAAKSAAPYIHPKLASMTFKGDPTAPIQFSITDAKL